MRLYDLLTFQQSRETFFGFGSSYDVRNGTGDSPACCQKSSSQQRKGAAGPDKGEVSMINSSEHIGKFTLKLVMTGVAVSCLGAAVVAAPLSITPKSKIYASFQTASEHTSMQPLSSGPAMQLGKAGAGEDEDCVKVTRMTGPDGTVYATRGLVCSN